MKQIERFLKVLLVSFLIVNVIMALLGWSDLRSSGRFTESIFQNIQLFIEYWLFWSINYVFIILVYTLALSSMLLGIGAVFAWIRAR